MHTDAFAYKSMQEVQIMKIKIKKIIKIGTILTIKKKKEKEIRFPHKIAENLWKAVCKTFAYVESIENSYAAFFRSPT